MERDTRTPGKRRADAFVELVQVAARLLDGDRSYPGSISGSARIVITVDQQTLTDQVTGTGHLPGVGRTTAR